MAKVGERTSGAAGLPHGSVPFHHIADPQLRDAMMKINENMAALEKRLAALEKTMKKEA